MRNGKPLWPHILDSMLSQPRSISHPQTQAIRNHYARALGPGSGCQAGVIGAQLPMTHPSWKMLKHLGLCLGVHLWSGAATIHSKNHSKTSVPLVLVLVHRCWDLTASNPLQALQLELVDQLAVGWFCCLADSVLGCFFRNYRCIVAKTSKDWK